MKSALRFSLTVLEFAWAFYSIPQVIKGDYARAAFCIGMAIWCGKRGEDK